ncbi:MAG: 6phosphogluconolactonase eukaryotic type [Tardiphaga sp.]|nr:6phosphogluconolactonase eukaryotic type [Tardiphaga sp.]
MTSPRSLIHVADADALAAAAAQRLMARIDANPGRAAICLTGGSSPKRLYELLATPDYAKAIPWDRVHWFIGDDRFVPQDDHLSNIGMARATFLDALAPRDHVHPIPTDAADPDTAAKAYETTLKQFYGGTTLAASKPLFDLVLMGIGPDGHTASLFPGYPAIEVRDRWVVGVPLAHVAPFVPRVTLTLPALASCREMLFLVSGADKREIATRALTDDTLPAARARSHHETIWLIDKDATPERLDVA